MISSASPSLTDLPHDKWGTISHFIQSSGSRLMSLIAFTMRGCGFVLTSRHAPTQTSVG
jgi:hypothetical protein